jgi:hypothetical protein
VLTIARAIFGELNCITDEKRRAHIALGHTEADALRRALDDAAVHVRWRSSKLRARRRRMSSRQHGSRLLPANMAFN